MSLPARLRAFGISKALDYLERDPDANLPKLMDWLDKYTGERRIKTERSSQKKKKSRSPCFARSRSFHLLYPATKVASGFCI